MAGRADEFQDYAPGDSGPAPKPRDELLREERMGQTQGAFLGWHQQVM